MNMYDYTKIGSCPICSKAIYAPTIWNGKGKLNKMRVEWPMPIYPTCKHQNVAIAYIQGVSPFMINLRRLGTAGLVRARGRRMGL